MERNPLGTFWCTYPNPVGQGNCLIAGIQFNAHASSIASVIDNQGNTWIAGPTASNSAYQTVALYYCLNAKPGITTVSIAFDGLGSQESAAQAVFAEFYNVASSGAFDGQAASAVSSSPGTIVTGSNGDLVYHWAVDGSDINVNGGNYNSTTPIVAGSGFTLLSADLQVGSCDQFLVQSALGPIAPSITKSGSATWESVAIALKGAPAGTAPSGMYIAHVQHTLVMSHFQGRPSPLVIQFPANGNLLVGSYDSADVIMVAPNPVTDSGGNTWYIAATDMGQDGNEPTQIVYGQGGTIDNALHGITLNTNGTATLDSFFVLYDVVGAAESAFDIATHTNGYWSTTGTGTTLQTSQLTPTTPNGITFATTSQSWETMQGCVGAGYYFDAAVDNLNFNYTLVSNGTPASTLDMDNGKAHIFNTSLAQVTFTYSYNNTSYPINSWGSVAAHFKAYGTPTQTQIPTSGPTPLAPTGLHVTQ